MPEKNTVENTEEQKQSQVQDVESSPVQDEYDFDEYEDDEFDESEGEHSSLFEAISNSFQYARENGNGTFWTAALTLAGIIGTVVGTFVRNLFTLPQDRISLSKAVEISAAKDRIKDDYKKDGRSRESGRESQDRGQREKNKAEKDGQKKGRDGQERDVKDAPDKKDKGQPEKDGQEKSGDGQEKPEEPMSGKPGQEAEDLGKRIMNQLLEDSPLRDALSHLGYDMKPIEQVDPADPDEGRLAILKDGEPIHDEYGSPYSVDRSEFTLGDPDCSKIMDILSQAMPVEKAAFDACLMQAGSNCLCDNGGLVASARFITPEGINEMTVTRDEEDKEKCNVRLNGKEVMGYNPMEFYRSEYNAGIQKLEKAVLSSQEHTEIVSPEMHINYGRDNAVSICIGPQSMDINVKSVEDISNVEEFFNKNGFDFQIDDENSVHNDSMAAAICYIANPLLGQEAGKDGFYNPFTREYAEPGAAHISSRIDGEGFHVAMNSPAVSMGEGGQTLSMESSDLFQCGNVADAGTVSLAFAIESQREQLLNNDMAVPGYDMEEMEGQEPVRKFGEEPGVFGGMPQGESMGDDMEMPFPDGQEEDQEEDQDVYRGTASLFGEEFEMEFVD